MTIRKPLTAQQALLKWMRGFPEGTAFFQWSGWGKVTAYPPSHVDGRDETPNLNALRLDFERLRRGGYLAPYPNKAKRWDCWQLAPAKESVKRGGKG